MIIYKYPLYSYRQQLVDMPRGAKLIDVQMQDGKAVLWAVVDTSHSSTKRIINCVMTGEPVPNSGIVDNHIATAQHNGIVAHFFDGGEYNL